MLPSDRPASNQWTFDSRGLHASERTGCECERRAIGPAYFSSQRQTVPSSLADATSPGCDALVYATATAVQITLRRGQSEAVGWLHMEGILSLPRLQRLGITSLVRLVNNEQSEDDDAALLEYLALSAQKHLLTFKLEVKPRKKSEASAHENDNGDSLRVDLERLAPTTEGSRWWSLPS